MLRERLRGKIMRAVDGQVRQPRERYRLET